ncbi:beta-amylase [Planoprotostelium fungivorum]|uniref:Beta-amylase n=1 Tax=Planoprotostelium fungivorum TaxID=1890364 RepID=A0A2P6NV74_9EUKA|nr:beta-amylase [Planoprotostelium fungivorum]
MSNCFGTWGKWKDPLQTTNGPTRSSMKTVLPLLLLLAAAAAVPTSVMLPLDVINNDGQLSDAGKLKNQFSQLKAGGVDGIMTDVWWGLVEKQPKVYNFDAYKTMFHMARDAGLHVQAVLSFHKCGGNVGDSCNIPLPSWVLDIGKTNPDIFYQGPLRQPDDEYLSCGVDNIALFQGRTAVQLYSDFMNAFASSLSDLLSTTITEVQVGLGPAGEMRYPSYQLSKWKYCGIGGFQAYDKYLLAELKVAADNKKRPLWGLSPPSDAGDYNSMPSDTGYFSSRDHDSVHSKYGHFFNAWYFNRLLKHGSDILSQANSIFSPKRVEVAAKISGIHWWYDSDHHAAELTAGYQNVNGVDAYLNIAKMFKRYNVTFDFTCLEMFDQNDSCKSKAATLVKQTRKAAVTAGVEYAGENALPICTDRGCSAAQLNQIVYQASNIKGHNIKQFTFLRLTDSLFNGSTWQQFVGFVRDLTNKK